MRRFRIGIGIVLITLLTGCGNGTNISEEAEPSQTEVNSPDMDSQNIVDDSDSDDIAEKENEAAEQKANTEDVAEETAGTDGSDDEDILYLKPCASYQDILDNAYDVIIADNWPDIVLSDELFSYYGLGEAHVLRDTKEVLSAVGYTFYDVDGNGIEELIIADTYTAGEIWYYNILLMYTLYDDMPVLLIDGWSRNGYNILDDGTIYHEGSSGAAYTSFGIYRISEAGNSLEVIDFYYSGYSDDHVNCWFYNTTGKQTYDDSEIIEFEDEDVLWNMMEDYMSRIKALELTPFSEFKENQ